VVFSGPAHSAAREAADELAQRWGVGVDLWSATSYKRLREDALAVDRYNRLHPGTPPRTPLVTSLLADGDGPVVAVTDYMTMVPDQVSRWVGRPFQTLGTDGFGRSDTRLALRRFFEVDAGHVVVAVLAALAEVGDVDPSVVVEAIDLHGIDAEAPDPGRYDTGPAPGHAVGDSTSPE
jgi:pyruvate dehydrogenase E1 component